MWLNWTPTPYPPFHILEIWSYVAYQAQLRDFYLWFDESLSEEIKQTRTSVYHVFLTYLQSIATKQEMRVHGRFFFFFKGKKAAFPNSSLTSMTEHLLTTANANGRVIKSTVTGPVLFLWTTPSGELRAQKWKSHLVRTQSLKVHPVMSSFRLLWLRLVLFMLFDVMMFHFNLIWTLAYLSCKFIYILVFLTSFFSLPLSFFLFSFLFFVCVCVVVVVVVVSSIRFLLLSFCLHFFSSASINPQAARCKVSTVFCLFVCLLIVVVVLGGFFLFVCFILS